MIGNFTDGSRWTDEQKAFVKAAWMDGFSAGRIAAMMHAGGQRPFATRNTVIGIVARMKLQRSPAVVEMVANARRRTAAANYERTKAIPSPERSNRKASGRKAKAPPVPALPVEPLKPVAAREVVVRDIFRPTHAKTVTHYEYAEPELPQSSLGLTLTELRAAQCHFPVGMRDGERLYCGLPVSEGKSYCAACCRVMYTPAKESASRYERSLRRWAA